MNSPAQKPAILYYTPAIIWGIFLSYYTLLPADKLPQELLDLNDKFLHLLIYFFSASLIYLGFSRYSIKQAPPTPYLIAIVVFCAVYGGLIELLQHYFVDNRKGEWFDFWANTAGALVSVLFWRLLQARKA